METKKFVRKLIKQAKGDDLCRAQMAFKGLSDVEMNKKHGNSGRTRREVL